MGLNVHVFDEDAPDDTDIEGQTENDVSFVPQERVQNVALKRARQVAEKHPDALVIAVAQVLFFNGGSYIFVFLELFDFCFFFFKKNSLKTRSFSFFLFTL